MDDPIARGSELQASLESARDLVVVADAIISNIVRLYEDATHGHPARRNLSKLMQWTQTARTAVMPRYSLGDHPPSEAIFERFVEACVILMVLIEDVEEIYRETHFEPIRGITRVIRRKIAREPAFDISNQPDFNFLPGRQRHYGFALMFAVHLTYHLFQFLTCKNQMCAVFSELSWKKVWVCLDELDPMQHFCISFNDLIWGKIPDFEFASLHNGERTSASLMGIPDTSVFVRQTQANMLMRFMLMASFMQCCCRQEDEHGKFFLCHFDLVDRLGKEIEAMGKLANDLATLPREIEEGFFCNSLIAMGIKESMITSEEIMCFHLDSPKSALADRFPSFHDLEQAIVGEWKLRWDLLKKGPEACALESLLDLDSFLNEQARFFDWYLSHTGHV